MVCLRRPTPQAMVTPVDRVLEIRAVKLASRLGA